MNFYLSDLHLGHYNIIKLSNRPFSSVEEMDETIITNWNKVITDNDDIYINGDFCFKSGKHPKEYLENLKGRKHLVVGNHDGRIVKDLVCRKYFVEIKDIIDICDNGKRVILCHYPMIEWNGYFRGAIHLYGHIHNNTENTAYKILKDIPNCYNVGADVLGFTPRKLQDIISLAK